MFYEHFETNDSFDGWLLQFVFNVVVLFVADLFDGVFEFVFEIVLLFVFVFVDGFLFAEFSFVEHLELIDSLVEVADSFVLVIVVDVFDFVCRFVFADFQSVDFEDEDFEIIDFLVDDVFEEVEFFFSVVGVVVLDEFFGVVGSFLVFEDVADFFSVVVFVVAEVEYRYIIVVDDLCIPEEYIPRHSRVHQN